MVSLRRWRLALGPLALWTVLCAGLLAAPDVRLQAQDKAEARPPAQATDAQATDEQATHAQGDPPAAVAVEGVTRLQPELMQRALAELQKGRTTLVIAHRLATARRADRILVLEQGRVQAGGTHDELFATNALYRRYWELQSLQQASGGREPPVGASSRTGGSRPPLA